VKQEPDLGTLTQKLHAGAPVCVSSTASHFCPPAPGQTNVGSACPGVSAPTPRGSTAFVLSLFTSVH
jgi:hypothetical protein